MRLPCSFWSLRPTAWRSQGSHLSPSLLICRAAPGSSLCSCNELCPKLSTGSRAAWTARQPVTQLYATTTTLGLGFFFFQNNAQKYFLISWRNCTPTPTGTELQTQKNRPADDLSAWQREWRPMSGQRWDGQRLGGQDELILMTRCGVCDNKKVIFFSQIKQDK